MTQNNSSVEIAQALQLRVNESVELFWLEGKRKRAIELCREALTQLRSLDGTAKQVAETLATLGFMFLHEGKHGRRAVRPVRLAFARKYYDEALVVLEPTCRNTEFLAHILANAADAYALSGRVAKAHPLIHKAIIHASAVTARVNPLRDQLPFFLAQRAFFYELEGNYEMSMHLLTEALDSLSRMTGSTTHSSSQSMYEQMARVCRKAARKASGKDINNQQGAHDTNN
jgi:tetratricopeptide (TPR) repeat protein